MQTTIIESMKELLKESQNWLAGEIKSVNQEISTKVKNIQNDLNVYKAKELFIETDDFEILNNKKLTNDQIKKLIIARKNHGIEVNETALYKYINRRPVNKDEYLNLQYVQ
jgi:hypothetical protein